MRPGRRTSAATRLSSTSSAAARLRRMALAHSSAHPFHNEGLDRQRVRAHASPSLRHDPELCVFLLISARSVFFREHDRQHALGDSGIARVGRVVSESGVEIIYFEKESCAPPLRKPQSHARRRGRWRRRNRRTRRSSKMMRATAAWPSAATPGVITARPPVRFCRNVMHR